MDVLTAGSCPSVVDQSPLCGASMQTRQGRRDSKCTGWHKRYQGAGAKRRRSRTGSKLKAKWVGVRSACLLCSPLV